ncbi:MFS transporter [Paralcaligenes sp. KSB-10]|uniref:MFS transporter n=1 Tax=Paralcaligenes sp. KSB-10 TaxID=2901142 RepID=UPI001E32E846|nr:MFS transporter [Paralcaligenes sp. KSB-10]UHL65061.1 MFS transporter [Paralcaligenes sp. KSB-10]
MSDAPFSFRKIAVSAFGPSLLFSIGEGSILPIIALSARDLGASVALAGLIVGLIGIGSLFSNIPAALIIARYGERRSMVAAAAFSVLAMIFCLIPNQIWLLALGVLMIGMASSVLMLARQTYLIEAVPIHMRARAMSTLGGTRRIGIFIGPFLGAALMHYMGLPGAYWIAIVAMLSSGLLAFTVPDLEDHLASKNAGANTAPTLTNIARHHWQIFLTLGFGILLVSGLRSARQIVIPLWADHLGLSPTATAIIYGTVSAIDMLAFYPAGKAMDQHGRLSVAMPSVIIMGISLILIPITDGLVSFVAVSMMIGLGNGIGSGIIMTLGADASPRIGRTQFLGIWRLIADVGASGAPALLSAVTALASLASAVVATGLLGFIAAGVFWRWLPRTKPDRPR